MVHEAPTPSCFGWLVHGMVGVLVILGGFVTPVTPATHDQHTSAGQNLNKKMIDNFLPSTTVFSILRRTP